MKNKFNSLLLSMPLAGLLAAAAAGAPTPVAQWAFPYGRDVSGTVRLGVVAYQQSGVTQVVFQVSGGVPAAVTKETLNPETGEMEFVLVLDTTGYADGTKTISATAWGGGWSTVLPDRAVWVANLTPKTVYYVATNGSDLASGTSDSPFASISNAVMKAQKKLEKKFRDDFYARSSEEWMEMYRTYHQQRLR